jgi:hypothetical protein
MANCVCRSRIFLSCLAVCRNTPVFPGMYVCKSLSFRKRPSQKRITYIGSHHLDNSLHVNWPRKQVQRPTTRRRLAIAIRTGLFFDGHDLLRDCIRFRLMCSGPDDGADGGFLLGIFFHGLRCSSHFLSKGIVASASRNKRT